MARTSSLAPWLFSCWLGAGIAFAQQGGAGRLAERFKQLDRNGDGGLTREELGRPADVFAEMDRDKSGTATLQEIGIYLRARARGGRPGPSGPGAEPAEFHGEFSADMPVTLASCRAAADYSAKANGHAVLVMVEGEVVYERYDNGWDEDTPHRLASGTKSFAGVTAAAAVEDGMFEFDSKVSDTITEWKNDPGLGKVTIRQLLSLTSGIDAGENSVLLSYSRAIETEAVHAPGARFEYGPNPFQVFGALMERKLADKGQNAVDYLKERIFDPIGMVTADRRETAEGDPHMPSGAFVTAREWAKFGELLRRGGKWKGEQIVRRELLDELVVGSEANPAYGMTFWLSREGGVGAGGGLAARTTTPASGKEMPKDLYMAAGAGKQRLFVIPSLKMVIVRFGETQGRRFLDNAFLGRLIEGRAAAP